MANAIPSRHQSQSKTERRSQDQWRGSASERGYDSDWNAVAALVRERDGYLCQECMELQGLEVAMNQLSRSKAANIVDHIIPVHVRPDLRLTMNNCRTLCRSHHAVKTNRDNVRYGSAEAEALTASQQRARHDAQSLVID